MPHLLCPSPSLVNHSFPRTDQQLTQTADALAELSELIENETVELVLTDAIAEIIEAYCWEPHDSHHLIQVVYRYLVQLFLQPAGQVHRLNVSSVQETPSHPIPVECITDTLNAQWAEEAGRLREIHAALDTDLPVIGVISSRAFARLACLGYPQGCGPCLPLVGPSGLSGNLLDGYEWQLAQHRPQVSFAAAKKNYRVIGAVRVEKPNGGSHYKLHFRGQRSWVLDKNDDPVPEPYLRELEATTGLPLGAIAEGLASGKLPPRRLRLHQYIC